jgi:hypothetical protein
MDSQGGGREIRNFARDEGVSAIDGTSRGRPAIIFKQEG